MNAPITRKVYNSFAFLATAIQLVPPIVSNGSKLELTNAMRFGQMVKAFFNTGSGNFITVEKDATIASHTAFKSISSAPTSFKNI